MDIFSKITQDDCKKMSEPSTGQFAISCALLAWLLVSYIPQFARIIGRKSAEGLSTLYILLGSISGTCAVANIMVLPTSQTDIACCRHYTRFGCISRLLGIFQVVSGVSLFWCIASSFWTAGLLKNKKSETDAICRMFLYVYFSEEEADAELHGRRRSLSSPDRTFRRARRAIRLLIIVVAFAFAIMLISAVILNRFPWYSQEWANVLGVCVACFACVQWVPQVWTTIHLGHLGSLSLASICMGAPYTWIFGINMILRLGLSGWSVWIVYVLVGIMQLTLIVTAIIYMIRDNRKARRADATSATASSSSRRDVSESPSTRALRPQLDRWNSFAAANAEDGGNERTPLLAGRNKHVEETASPRRVI
ncbi:hypothetical protein D6D28_09171 [Aureobasidium pullulans]|uniref:PQ loop repeat protein n=1 Tax=Aureobasidium pullulans TaxID=5580 RepID=A0A4S8S5B7_AURPU|nr:hypothetical protein D6D28_09171 [Aureobasidium pullulans]